MRISNYRLFLLMTFWIVRMVIRIINALVSCHYTMKGVPSMSFAGHSLTNALLTNTLAPHTTNHTLLMVIHVKPSVHALPPRMVYERTFPVIHICSMYMVHFPFLHATLHITCLLACFYTLPHMRMRMRMRMKTCLLWWNT